MSGAGRRWLAAWPGAALIGVANGALREGTLGRWLPAGLADRISALTLIGGLGLYFRALQRRWPLEDGADALGVGASWAALTVGFEFGFGRLVAGDSWEELLGAYDLRRGELWPLVLAWIAIGPQVTRRPGASAQSSV